MPNRATIGANSDGSDRTLLFWCPGCDEPHGIPVDGSRGWTWNGSLEAPTVTPSLLLKPVSNPARWVCHSFITDGRIQFLDDCTHSLAGQTVEVPEWDSAWRTD